MILCHSSTFKHFRDFVDVCKVAIEVNGRLITTEQLEYQNVLKENYRHLAIRLSEILREQVIMFLHLHVCNVSVSKNFHCQIWPLNIQFTHKEDLAILLREM